MNILEELKTALSPLRIPIETGVFKGKAPNEYLVFTPLSDVFLLHTDDLPRAETQQARISLYSKGNYLARKSAVIQALLTAGLTITGRVYVGHEDDTGYHHYAIDVAQVYEL